MAYRNYHPANGFHVSQDGNGDYKTITAASNALTTASLTGVSVFIHDGTYTENPPLAAGCDYIAFTADSNEPNVTINGTCTFSSAGTVSISGIRFQTNSADFLQITGSAASIVTLKDCYLNATNNNGITYNSTSANSALNIFDCKGDLGAAAIPMLTDSSAGNTTIANSVWTNSGLSTSPCTKSAGSLFVQFSKFSNAFSYSSTSGNSSFLESVIDCSTINTAAITTSGTGGINVTTGYLAGGTASAVVIGSGTILGLSNINLSSSNTNAIAGSGTVQIAAVSFTGTSSTIQSTLTVTRFITRPSFSTKNQVFTSSGTYTPTAGMVFCQIEIVGGGGGSGGNANPGAGNVAVTAGGGGGGYARKIFTSATIGASQTVTIGAAGTAGASGNNSGGAGGTTSVGALISATGGGGSAGSAGNAVAQSQNGGAGGVGSSGDINVNGGPGGLAVGFFSQAITGGYGGSSYFGLGQSQDVANAQGANDSIYGTGASGNAITAAGGAFAGAAGVAGAVIIQEYILS